MRLVIALGGNALARRGERLEADTQRERVRAAVTSLVETIREHEVVITHGNGPQVGLLALQAEAYREVETYPLDVLSAESQGMIGYWMAQALDSRIPEREVIALLTQVEVDPNDPALRKPTKPIGPLYSEQEARQRAAERGWSITDDEGGFRRVVPSPHPLRIRELSTVKRLLESGVLVVCGGGGGVPVTVHEDGDLSGVEAVIDKDHTAALLAREIGADRLLVLTDVPAVCEDWPDPAARPIRSATPEALVHLSFDPGSMGPKVDAASEFASLPGRVAAIGALNDTPAILREDAGTTIRADAGPTRYHAASVIRSWRKDTATA